MMVVGGENFYNVTLYEPNECKNFVFCMCVW